MRRSSGFSLLEVLLYAAFVGIILTSVILLATMAFTARSKVRTELVLKQNVRYALAQIALSVADATGITSPAIGVTSSTLVLGTSVTSTNPTTFTLTNGTITMSQGTGTALALLSNEVSLSNFTFTRVSSTTPTVRIVVSGGILGAAPNYPTMVVTSTAAIRR